MLGLHPGDDAAAEALPDGPRLLFLCAVCGRVERFACGPAPAAKLYRQCAAAGGRFLLAHLHPDRMRPVDAYGWALPLLNLEALPPGTDVPLLTDWWLQGKKHAKEDCT